MAVFPTGTPRQHDPGTNLGASHRPATCQSTCAATTSSSLKIELPDIAPEVRKPLRRLWLPKIAGSSSASRQRRFRITPYAAAAARPPPSVDGSDDVRGPWCSRQSFAFGRSLRKSLQNPTEIGQDQAHRQPPIPARPMAARRPLPGENCINTGRERGRMPLASRGRLSRLLRRVDRQPVAWACRSLEAIAAVSVALSTSRCSPKCASR